MKLGISYIVFEGEELLGHAIKAIRPVVDFVSVIYQTTSFYGLPAHPELVHNLKQIKEIDYLYHYCNDLNISRAENEVNIRNFGLEISKKFGCIHHISADVDEFYELEWLEYAKRNFSGDCSVVFLENYFKKPTFRIAPSQRHVVSFIHPVSTKYNTKVKFPFNVDITRKCDPCENCKVFTEFVMHHMSFVRKNIRRKLENSSNITDIDEFVDFIDKYEAGGRLRTLPDRLFRKTVVVEDLFKIGEF